jgi:hypothetical protein
MMRNKTLPKIVGLFFSSHLLLACASATPDCAKHDAANCDCIVGDISLGDLYFYASDSKMDEQDAVHKLPKAAIKISLPVQRQIKNNNSRIKDPLRATEFQISYQTSEGIMIQSENYSTIVNGSGEACRVTGEVISSNVSKESLSILLNINYVVEIYSDGSKETLEAGCYTCITAHFDQHQTDKNYSLYYGFYTFKSANICFYGGGG